ncbi:MAG: hypothetical protein ACM3TU_01105 [Bacillota bacterium]
MSSELTNLLPPERLKAQRQEYFIRLATVSIFMLSFVLIASGVLLAPSYLFLHQEMQGREAHIQELDARLNAIGGEAATKRLAAVATNAMYIARLASTTTSTAAIRTVLDIPRPGITISGFTFTAPIQDGKTTMMITGTAATRESLRSYALTLGQQPFISGVDLPISAYAKEADIPFSITLTGTFKP